jgi:protein SCO1/2
MKNEKCGRDRIFILHFKFFIFFMDANKVRAAIVLVLIVLPVSLYFFLKFNTTAVYNTIPFQYSISPETGDTLWHELPEFNLKDVQSGEAITRNTLLGNVWVVGFFDQKDELIEGGPRKPRPFPLMLDNMEAVYTMVKDVPSIKFLLINTAFARDSMPQIKALSDSLNLLGTPYQLAIGDRENVFRLGLETFRLSAFQGHQRDTLPFTSQQVALIDKKGRVRKYYIATKMFDMEKVLLDDIRALYKLEYEREFLGE